MIQAIIERIYPGKIFEDRKGICVVKDKVFSAAGATNNQEVIAAVSGKIIMVLSGNFRSTNATGALTFKSATGGTNKRVYQVPATTSVPQNVPLPYEEIGHFRTAVGEGLFVDNSGADAITISLTYIEYTP